MNNLQQKLDVSNNTLFCKKQPSNVWEITNFLCSLAVGSINNHIFMGISLSYSMKKIYFACGPVIAVPQSLKHRINLGNKTNLTWTLVLSMLQFPSLYLKKLYFKECKVTISTSICMVNLVFKKGLTRLGVLLIYPGVECQENGHNV